LWTLWASALGFTVIGLPCEFTIPDPAPWHERQSVPAKRARGVMDSPQITSTAANRMIRCRRDRVRGDGTFCRDGLPFGVTMGLFAGSDWGKMRMFLKNRAYFMTPSLFSCASADFIAVQVPQYSTLVPRAIDKNSVSP
jgi:hypothetical protein